MHSLDSAPDKCWCFSTKTLTVRSGEKSGNSGKLPDSLALGSVPILNLN